MRVLTDHAKKRAAAKELAAEEQVSLIGAPDGKRPARPTGSKAGRRRTKNGSSSNKSPPWTLTRLLKYFSMSAGMAVFTFLMLRKEQKDLHWEQYHTLLEPGTKEARCYVSFLSPGFLFLLCIIFRNHILLYLIITFYFSPFRYPGR